MRCGLVAVIIRPIPVLAFGGQYKTFLYRLDSSLTNEDSSESFFICEKFKGDEVMRVQKGLAIRDSIQSLTSEYAQQLRAADKEEVAVVDSKYSSLLERSLRQLKQFNENYKGIKHSEAFHELEDSVFFMCKALKSDNGIEAKGLYGTAFVKLERSNELFKAGGYE